MIDPNPTLFLPIHPLERTLDALHFPCENGLTHKLFFTTIEAMKGFVQNRYKQWIPFFYIELSKESLVVDESAQSYYSNTVLVKRPLTINLTDLTPLPLFSQNITSVKNSWT